MKSKMTRNYPLNRFSVAPMLDWTDRHCRYFHRLLTQQALLYTEMVTTGAILHGKGDYLSFSEQEQPVSLQLGGCDPNALAQCAKLAQQYGYSEINLNVGCPSDRVQNGRFGACLMADAQLVAHCVAVMRDAVSLPITVKCRIGIDDQDDYAFLVNFINKVSNVGCDSFILHARKAWLSGLSPKQNREIPPLDYERVYQIKRDFPQLMIAVNGGIKSLEEAQEHLKHVDGVMIGREAYQNPALLLGVDSLLFNQSSQYKNGIEVVEALYPYISAQLSQGVYLGHMTRHILGLFHGLPGAKQFRRYLSENAHRSGADLTVLETALSFVERGHNK